MERSRRNVDAQAGRTRTRNALAELAAARAGGATGRRANTYQPKEEAALYDVVDEDEYARLVAKRRMEAGDFLEDDGDGEYADDGADEELFGGGGEGGGGDDGGGEGGAAGKRKGGAGKDASEAKRRALEREEAQQRAANRDRMAQMFARATATAQRGAAAAGAGAGAGAGPSNAAAGGARGGPSNAARGGRAGAHDDGGSDALLADILGELDDGPAAAAGGTKKPAVLRRAPAAAAAAGRRPAGAGAAAAPRAPEAAPAPALVPAPRAIGSVWDTEGPDAGDDAGHDDDDEDGGKKQEQQQQQAPAAPGAAADNADGFTFDVARAAPAAAIDSQQPPFGAAGVKAEEPSPVAAAVKAEPLSPHAAAAGCEQQQQKPARRRFADDAPAGEAADGEPAAASGWQAMFAAGDEAANANADAGSAAAAAAVATDAATAASPASAAAAASASAAGDLVLDPADGSLPFYFLDAYENPDRPDTLFLFGKVQAKGSAAVKQEEQAAAAASGGSPSPAAAAATAGPPQWISCCAVVPNCHFSLIVVPTPDVFADPDGELAALEEKAAATAAAAAASAAAAGAKPAAAAAAADAETKPDAPAAEAAASEARLALLRALHARCAELKEELRAVMRRHGVRSFRVVPVKRDYAFEQPDVPRGRQWVLKVRVPATEPRLPLGLRGERFVAVFGTNQSSLEALLVKRGVKGPGWLSLRGALARRSGSAAASWCRAEVALESPKAVCPPAPSSPLAGRPAPPLVVASLALRLRTDAATQASEVVSASVLHLSGVPCDAPAPRELWCGGGGSSSSSAAAALRNFTIVRKLDGRPWPPGFEAAVAAENASPRGRLNGGQMVATAPNERALLSLLLARLAAVDADVLVGHNIGNFELPLLLQRLSVLKVPLWSRVGRLKRQVVPRLTGGGHAFGGGAPPGVVACLSGRLLADTYVSARELLREVDYTLRTLSRSLLGQDRPELPGGAGAQAMAARFDSAEGVGALLRHGEGDAWLSLGVLFQLSVLPLAKQLANLSGSLWSRVLQGARAQRIEFLLLHEFHARKFILPDKLSQRDKAVLLERRAAAAAGGGGAGGTGGGKASASNKKGGGGGGGEDAGADDQHGADGEDDHEGDEAGGGRGAAAAGGASGGASTKGPQYAGGLVLEPKKGLYDSVVLVLDFNSLYPSIIQEFNICFTTVERPEDGGPPRLPPAPAPAAAADGGGGSALPSSSSSMAPLPAVIQQLVRRRREVKALMKGCGAGGRADPLRYQQLNIRQQALKLTANSMYGCLGFAHSRFYARPLAELVTAQGREILQSTVDLVGGLAAEQTASVAAGGGGGGGDGSGAAHTFAPLADVIYGDTDSIMVHTGTKDVAAAVRLGERVKREVNRRYRLLEIELDAVFRAMLLLKKKKYAAVKLTPRASGGPGGGGLYDEELEAKGLDIVRRDWCGLAKDCGLDVLREVLCVAAPPSSSSSPSSPSPADAPSAPPPHERSVEDSVALVHERLRALRARLDAGQVPLAQLAVVKQLTKRPEDYPDAKNQPHVQVALRRRAAGKREGTMPGETVPYVICVRRAVGGGGGGGGEGDKGEEGERKEGGKEDCEAGQEKEEEEDKKKKEAEAAAVAASAALPLAMRAYHPDEVRDDPSLAVDVEYYLGQQVLPVVARLLAPLEGLTDAGRLADCLGLQASKYARGLGLGAGGAGGAGGGSGSWWADALREGALNACGGGPLLDDDAHYAECDPLVLRAPNGTAFEFKGVRAHLRSALRSAAAAAAAAGGGGGNTAAAAAQHDAAAAEAASLLTPPDAVGDASAALSFAQAGNQALLAARRAVAAYYEGRLRSDDDVAAAETRDVTLAGRGGGSGARGGARGGGAGGGGEDEGGGGGGVVCPPGTCLAPSAPGGAVVSAPAFLHRAIGEDRLYTQLSYYVRLLDASGAVAALAGGGGSGAAGAAPGAAAAEQAARRQAAAQALGGPAAVAALDAAARAVAKLRDASGYRWIEMGALFAAVGAANKGAAAGTTTPGGAVAGGRRGSVRAT